MYTTPYQRIKVPPLLFLSEKQAKLIQRNLSRLYVQFVQGLFAAASADR